jgi:heme-degrading monooxygenase HmoA
LFSTIYFFQFNSLSGKWWAFKQMREAHPFLTKVPGQVFYKLLGSGGGNGFGLWPDWSTYVLLQSWRSKEDFESFRTSHQWFAKARQQAVSVGWAKLKAFKSHGTWNKQQPFNGQAGNAQAACIAVLTRARIKGKLLHKFWRDVPHVSKHVRGFEGLVLAKGIGELPLIEQATFSIWDNEKLMQAFAYRDAKHAEMVQKTRSLEWYSEELFARFEVEEFGGMYKGVALDALFQNRKDVLQSERL